jgi:hypothetical protein
MNGVGNGTYGEVTATTCNVPQTMSAVSLAGTVLYNSIPITWPAVTSVAATGNDPIIYYEVRYKSCSTCSQSTITTISDGLFTSYTYTLASGSFPNGGTVYFTVCAENQIGMGACSADFAVNTCSSPLQMVAPTLSSTVLYNQIKIQWDSITDDSYTGGSPVTYYEVRYKPSSTDSYTPLTTSAIGVTNAYTHTLASGSFPNNGTVYYTICAQNMVDMGACSPDFPVLACSSPLQMVAPTLAGTVLYN